MHCFVYKSSKKDETYLFVPARGDGTASAEADLSRVPDALLGHLGALELVMQLELTPERTLARARVEDVKEGLVSRGFYLQLPPGEHERSGTRH
jgi:uncharacterized protein YcgL (UPF0745 family)